MFTNTLRKVTLVTIVPDCKCGFIEAAADEQSFWSHEWACPYVAGFDVNDTTAICAFCGHTTEDLGEVQYYDTSALCCTPCFIAGY